VIGKQARKTGENRGENRPGKQAGKTGQPELSDLRDGIEAPLGFVQRDPVRAGLVENSRSSG
jgi:hypothetical protein